MSHVKPGAKTERDQKRVGVVLSGGGWRAMENGAYFMDTLRAKDMLKNIAVVAGLSGGSWTCIIGAMSGDKNRFYIASENFGQPWSHGGVPSNADSDPTKIMIERMAYFLDERRAKESLNAPDDNSGTVQRWKNKLISVAISAGMGADFSKLFDSLVRDTSKSMLYNYSTVLRRQFFDGSVDAPLHQPDTVAPVFVVATLAPKEVWYEVDGKGKRIRQVGTRVEYPIDRCRLGFHKNTIQEPFCAPHVMATCGAPIYRDGWIESILGVAVDDDMFSTGLLSDGKEVTRLYDAGTSCNIPVHLAHGRCDVSFVVDSSAGDRAAEQLAIAVKKGYYHIYVPEGVDQATFVDKNVQTWSTDGGDTVRVYFPAKGYSASLWGDNTKALDGKDEPILIFVKSLREISTFRMDRTRAEIEQNHQLVAASAGIAIDALHWLENLQTLPPAGFGVQSDFTHMLTAAAPPRPQVPVATDEKHHVFAWMSMLSPTHIMHLVERTVIGTKEDADRVRGVVYNHLVQGSSLLAVADAVPPKLLNERFYHVLAWVHVSLGNLKSNGDAPSAIKWPPQLDDKFLCAAAIFLSCMPKSSHGRVLAQELLKKPVDGEHQADFDTTLNAIVGDDHPQQP